MRSPFSRRRKYSPCSLKLVYVGLKFGAHFRIPSNTQRRLWPVKLLVVPAGSSKVRSWGEVLRYETPVCHAVPVPKSPPRCVKTLPELTPFLLRPPAGPAGNCRPRPPLRKVLDNAFSAQQFAAIILQSSTI